MTSSSCDRELNACFEDAECEACEAFSPPATEYSYDEDIASFSEYCSGHGSGSSGAACENDGVAICCHDELSSLENGVGCLDTDLYFDYVMCAHQMKGCSIDDVRCIDSTSFTDGGRTSKDVWIVNRKGTDALGRAGSPAISSFAAASCALGLLAYVAATARRRRGRVFGGLKQKLVQYSE